MAILDEGQTLYQAVCRAAELFSDREALVVGDIRLTYPQLVQQLDALADGLQRLGLEKGERVAIILPACLESVLTLIGPAKAGLTIVPLNPLLRAHEVRYILADSGAAALITVAEMLGHDYVKMIEAIRPQLPALRHVVVKGTPRGQGVVSLDEVMAHGQAGPARPVEAGPDDTLGFFYTSGTTGLPKGAVQPQRNLLGTLDSLLQAVIAAALQSGTPIGQRQTVGLTPLPLFHYGGIVTTLLLLCTGGKLVIQERFNPQQTLALLEREGVQWMTGVPTMYQAMLQAPDFDRYDLSALASLTTAAAPCSPELIQAIETRTPARMTNAYGLTEVGVVTSTSGHDPAELRLNTVGRPMPGVELRIVDDARQDLPAGQPGEVAIRTPYALKGYHNRPEASAEVLDAEGWFYSGDVGFLDEAGYLHLVDRKKDVVIRGGENVYPVEVEHFLMTHPAVQLAAVVGVPAPVGGERLRAYLIPKPGAALTEREVLDYCRGQIAPYKMPDQVRFVPELPMTATQKVQKFVLREQARRELEQA